MTTAVTARANIITKEEEMDDAAEKGPRLSGAFVAGVPVTFAVRIGWGTLIWCVPLFGARIWFEAHQPACHFFILPCALIAPSPLMHLHLKPLIIEHPNPSHPKPTSAGTTRKNTATMISCTVLLHTVPPFVLPTLTQSIQQQHSEMSPHPPFVDITKQH